MNAKTIASSESQTIAADKPSRPHHESRHKMTGIGGLHYLDGRLVQSEDVHRLVSAAQSRSPRPVSVAVDRCVGLVHWDLSAVPGAGSGVSHGSARRDGLHAIGTIRIDRRDDLIRRLGVVDVNSGAVDVGSGVVGVAPRPDSDVLLITLAYEKWGEQCVQHIEGAFAFAIWDERRRRLFCARDRLGLRPFYYAHTESFLAFASEIGTLHALSGVSGAVNEERMADYLMQFTDDKGATFFEGIYRLPPAHTLIASSNGIRMQPYWRLDPEREIRLESDEAYAHTFRDLFTGAVRDRIDESSSLGSLLSGGLDSSAVACTARALIGADETVPLRTFSALFDDVPESDERRYIDRVCEGGGFQPHFIRGDRVDPFEDLDQMLTSVEEPFITPNLYLHWHLWKRAREEGVEVMLDGFLGDNVVSHGSRYLTELAVRGRWISLAREIRNVTQRHGQDRRAGWRIFKRFVLLPGVKEPAIRLRNRFANSEATLPARARFVQRDLLEHVRRRERDRTPSWAPRSPMTVREEHFEDLTGGALPSALETAYKSASAFGLEPRFPFADRRLVEFCLAIPPTQRYSRGVTRVVARRAMKDTVPDAVLARYDKADLGPSFARSLLVTGGDELRAHVFELLPTAASYLNVGALQTAYLSALRSPPSHRALLPIWQAVVLARWLKNERDQQTQRRSILGRESIISVGDRASSGRFRNFESIQT